MSGNNITISTEEYKKFIRDSEKLEVLKRMLRMKECIMEKELLAIVDMKESPSTGQST